ncbi:MAG: GIY-YIG nuclease family protein [Thermoplasmata archaeon]
MESRGRNLVVRHRFEARNLDGKAIWDVPDSWGVYVLRDRKFNVSYVGSTPNLRTRLYRHFQSRDIPDAKYFECYQVESEKDALELLEEIKKTKRAVA